MDMSNELLEQNKSEEASAEELDAVPAEKTPVEAPAAEEVLAVEETPVEVPAAEEAPAEPAKENMEEKKAPAKTLSPEKKKKIILLAGGGAVLALVIFLILFFAVIRPNAIYNDAVEALQNKEFEQCQQLLDSIPNHKKTDALQDDLNIAQAWECLENKDYARCRQLVDASPNHEEAPAIRDELTIAQAQEQLDRGNLDQAELLLVSLVGNAKAQALNDEITYQRAVRAVGQGNLDEAREHLNKIPNYEDRENIRPKLKYAEAMAAVETGDYKLAYTLLSQLGDYEDAAKQREIVYYEALAFKTLFVVQDSLKNPSSLRITKVTFYKDSSNSDELDLIVEITASNSYGGSVGGHVYDLTLYDGDDDSGLLSHSAYVDPDTYIELLEQMIIDSVKKQSKLTVTVDVARMNRLLKNDVTFNIDLPFSSGAIADN